MHCYLMGACLSNHQNYDIRVDFDCGNLLKFHLEIKIY
jgi:hypothetical protein